MAKLLYLNSIKYSAMVKMARSRYRRFRRRARRYYGRFRRYTKKPTFPIAPIVGVATPFLAPCPSGRTLLADVSSGNFVALGTDVREAFVGMDSSGKLHGDWLLRTYMPPVIGILIHKVVGSMLGVNRVLARAKVPYLRV